MSSTTRILGVLIAASSLVACSHTTTQAVNAAAPATTTAQTEPASNDSGGPTACDLVPLPQAEQAVGHSLRPDPNNDAHPASCTYLPTEPGDLSLVKISLTTNDTSTTGETSTIPGAVLKDVQGLGDDAHAIDNVPVGNLTVDKDNNRVVIAVTDSQTNNLDAEKTLAQVALTNL